jgi:acetyl-CoA carboxylase carboxyltransferase component
MKRFESQINSASDDFVANYKHNLALCNELEEKVQDWSTQGTDRRIQQFRKKNKLLARERLELLLDEDSPFLEITPLAGAGMEDVAKGNSMIAGIGLVNGTECMIVVNVPTVGFGSMNHVNGKKWQRVSQMSMENKLPFIQLLESSGADLTNQFDIFHNNPNAFYSLGKRSAAKIPSVSVVFGTCIAGGAYFAGMTDYIVMVKGNAQLALAGKKLTEVATGEVSEEEELGGAAMHASVSGVCDFLANNEHEAICKARELISNFPAGKETVYPTQLDAVDEPYYPTEELLGVVPMDVKHGYDCKEVMARIVDGSRLEQFKPLYGPTLSCCFGHIYGVPVGLIGNNGVLFTETAQKGTHFINICNQRGIPIIFLHNVTGFMVGKKYERTGIIKWGSQLVNAATNSVVPIISIIIGNSFGAANYAQRGHGFQPRFIFSWPNSKCAVMGPDQLSGVLRLLAIDGAKKKGRAPDLEKLNRAQAIMKAKIETEMNAYYISARQVDDGVIDPRDTRWVLGMALSACCNSKIEKAFLQGICRL